MAEASSTQAVCYTAGRIFNTLNRPALSLYGQESVTLSEDGTGLLVSLADPKAPNGQRLVLVTVKDVT